MGLESALERIFDTLDAGGHVHDLMRGDEAKRGFEVIRPGDRPWLSEEDWHDTIVVSIDRDHVRLVAILAKYPGTGALTRTIAGIKAAGLVPMIVEPTREMRETCKRWGWKMRKVGYDFDTFEEQWRPKFRRKQ